MFNYYELWEITNSLWSGNALMYLGNVNYLLSMLSNDNVCSQIILPYIILSQIVTCFYRIWNYEATTIVKTHLHLRSSSNMRTSTLTSWHHSHNIMLASHSHANGMLLVKGYLNFKRDCNYLDVFGFSEKIFLFFYPDLFLCDVCGVSFETYCY